MFRESRKRDKKAVMDDVPQTNSSFMMIPSVKVVGNKYQIAILPLPISKAIWISLTK